MVRGMELGFSTAEFTDSEMFQWIDQIRENSPGVLDSDIAKAVAILWGFPPEARQGLRALSEEAARSRVGEGKAETASFASLRWDDDLQDVVTRFGIVERD